MKVLIVIPSRYGSTRFEGKPLIDIHGKTLVQRTYLQAMKANLDAKVVVATDDDKIYAHVKTFGECTMTSAHHISGTDRCFEVADVLQYDFDVLINLQGDEPFILPEQIEALAAAFEDPSVDIATLKKAIKSSDDLFNANMVKVISGADDTAIYFSRQAIPHVRGIELAEWVSHYAYYRHVGMYAFKREAIAQLKDLKASGLELAESLEQLRWLENGFKIKVLKTDFVSPAIDTPADLVAVENFLKSNPELI
jgi:3-deoxy-manno-octulosonate cytidylyltransferase (CMP-KDO synthetase)